MSWFLTSKTLEKESSYLKRVAKAVKSSAALAVLQSASDDQLKLLAQLVAAIIFGKKEISPFLQEIITKVRRKKHIKKLFGSWRRVSRSKDRSFFMKALESCKHLLALMVKSYLATNVIR